MTNKTPTIESTRQGYLRISCDGRHDFASHLYLYYTPEEAIEDWVDQHEQEGPRL